MNNALWVAAAVAAVIVAWVVITHLHRRHKKDISTYEALMMERSERIMRRQEEKYREMRAKRLHALDEHKYVKLDFSDIRPTLVRAAGKPPTQVKPRGDTKTL